MDDTTKSFNASSLAASRLPKPITMTGTAFEDMVKEEEKIQEETPAAQPSDSSAPAAADDTTIPTVSSDDTSALPMPIVFGEEEDEENEKTEENEKPKEEVKIQPESVETPQPQTLPQPQEVIAEPSSANLPRFTFEPEVIEKLETPEPAISQHPIIADLPQIYNTTPPDSQETERPAVKPEEKSSISSSDIPPLNIGSIEPKTSNPSTLPVYEEKTPSSVLPSFNQNNADTNPNNISAVPGTSEEFDIPPLHTTTLESHTVPATPNVMPSEVQTILHSSTASNPPVFTPPQDPQIGGGNGGFSQSTASGSNPFARVMLGLVALAAGSSIVVGGYFAASKIFGKPQPQTNQQAVVESQPNIPDPNTAQTAPTATPVSTPAATSTPTPQPNIDKSKVKVKVLNGSGEKGIANKVKALLETAGYKNVKTGNAENYDYKDTTINYKPQYATLLDSLTTDLGGTYKVVKGDELKSSVDFDLYVIVGSSSGSATTKPTTSPSPSPSPKADASVSGKNA